MEACQGKKRAGGSAFGFDEGSPILRKFTKKNGSRSGSTGMSNGWAVHRKLLTGKRYGKARDRAIGCRR
jgi:hypothetical protein